MSRPEGADPAADEDVRADDIQPEAAPDPDDTVQVEHEGQTYEVPAALKGALMRHADYTRKTQELADHRRALEAGHQVLAQMAEAHGQDMGGYARLTALENQIAHLQQQDWPGLQRQNPAAAQQLLTQLFQMKQAHEIAAGQLQHKQRVQAFDQQREHARQVEHAHGVLGSQIDGWSPDYGAKLGQFAISQGLTPDEVSDVSDPRLVLLLHHAYRGHQADQQHAAAERLAQVQTVRPAIQVGGGGPGPQDPNRMSTDDWMRHRRSQVRKKAR
jgi:hypothetical protein